MRIESDYLESDVAYGYHALTCWVSTQMELASLLGYFGLEKESEDVFANVSAGMGKNILAVGEYNRSVNAQLQAVDTAEEIGKDTPRFPPYPRYKSSWEYLVCLLGMRASMEEIRFSPMHHTDMELKNIILAGMRLNISVKKGWSECYINGVKAQPVLKRKQGIVTLEFK